MQKNTISLIKFKGFDRESRSSNRTAFLALAHAIFHSFIFFLLIYIPAIFCGNSRDASAKKLRSTRKKEKGTERKRENKITKVCISGATKNIEKKSNKLLDKCKFKHNKCNLKTKSFLFIFFS